MSVSYTIFDRTKTYEKYVHVLWLITVFLCKEEEEERFKGSAHFARVDSAKNSYDVFSSENFQQNGFTQPMVVSIFEASK